LAFGDLDSEATERAEGGISTLDALLATTYSRSQIYLSRQLAQLHPELTMPMFSGISARTNTDVFFDASAISTLCYYYRNNSSASDSSTDC
jgi:hypothetical protein